jgi:hypothetical protein
MQESNFVPWVLILEKSKFNHLNPPPISVDVVLLFPIGNN